jgi:hypothetical protein
LQTINSVNAAAQSVAVNGNVLFATDRVRTGSCGCCGAIQHDTGSGLFTLAKPGIYKVDFNANITAATAGAIALAMRVNGETVGGTEMDYTVVTANVYQSVSASTLIKVCPGTSKTVAVANVSPALAALVKDANIIVNRLA